MLPHIANMRDAVKRIAAEVEGLEGAAMALDREAETAKKDVGGLADKVAKLKETEEKLTARNRELNEANDKLAAVKAKLAEAARLAAV